MVEAGFSRDVDRYGTICFLEGFYFLLFESLVSPLLNSNRPTLVGRLLFSKAEITFCCFRHYSLGAVGIVCSKGKRRC